ncbi:hypothetical protein [Pseudovibrio exalbescens]|uniref:hypothetical protein n=1 Tax=Pseudovibrio exalbescens TaxID=197461 RepID=UPI000C9BA76F|nr:hypothetical protein [Pseudovibrio exalbescens]
MPYCVVPANSYGIINEIDFNSVQFLTGGQASCTVVWVLIDTDAGQQVAMAHVLSANLNDGYNGNPVDAGVCEERLAGFWDNYLAQANKGNIRFFTGQNPGNSTENATQAIKNALNANDNPGDYNNPQAAAAEYAVAADGQLVLNGAPSWAQAKNAVLGLSEDPQVRTNITLAMAIGMDGNTLHANTSLVAGIENVDVP